MRKRVILHLRTNRRREDDHDTTMDIDDIPGASDWTLSLKKVQTHARKLLSKKRGNHRLALDSDDDVWQLVSKDTCDIIIDMDAGTRVDRNAVVRFRRAMCAVPCTMTIPTLYIVQKPVPPTFAKSKPNGQTHAGLDEIIRQYYIRMQRKYTKQFLAFCDKNQMSEKELKHKLFDDHTECEYLAFDEQFPFTMRKHADNAESIQNPWDHKRIFHPRRRYPQTIRGLELCLRDHYRSVDDADFSSGVGCRSIFEEWHASRPGLQHQDLKSRKRLQKESDDLLRFLKDKERNFPLASRGNSSRKKPRASGKIHGKEVFQVLKHCVLFGCCPTYDSMELTHNRKSLRDFLRFCFQHSRPRELPLIITDYDAPATEADKQRCQQMLEKQWMGQLALTDAPSFFSSFAAGYANGNYNFMLHLVDSYQRDLVHCSATTDPHLMDQGDQRIGTIADWISNAFVRQHFADKPLFMKQLEQALGDYESIMKHPCELLELNPSADHRIRDDLVDICRYLVCFGQFVARCLPRAERVPTPFVADCMMAVSDVHSRTTLRETLVQGLKSECCRYARAPLVAKTWDQLYVARTVETMTSCFEELKRDMQRTGNCSEHYPKHRRFCVYVNRTAEKKEDDELFMFSPPNNVNQLDTDAHIPQIMREMSAECLIPRPNYHEGTDAAGSAFSTRTKFGRAPLMTFSFHVESTEQIRVYLHFNGRSLRFYPQDMVEVLPNLFRDTRPAQIAVAQQRYVNALNMIRDPCFEQFYRHLCAKDVDQFPSREYEQYWGQSVWERMSLDNADALVAGYLARGLTLVAEPSTSCEPARALICQYLIG